MKKLIEKIKSWFNKKEPKDTIYIFDKCDELAKKYGTRCSGLNVQKTYYHHSDDTGVTVYIHSLKGYCESVKFESQVDIDRILAVWELMLIKDYGKAKEM